MGLPSENARTGSAANKVDEVVENILERIRTHQMCAGDRIPTENELCELTNISRTSVREALKRLEALTIVQIRRGDGTYISQPEEISFVTPMTFKMLLSNVTWQEVLQFREMLDFIVIRCAIANANQEDIDCIRSCNARIEELSRDDEKNSGLVYQADLEFHKALADATKNRIVSDLYSASYEIFGEIVHRNYLAGQTIRLTCVHHDNMVRAIENRDTMMAAYAAHAAIQNWASWVHKHDSPMYYFMPTDNPGPIPERPDESAGAVQSD